MDATAWHRYFPAAVFKWVMTVRVACLIYLACIFAWDWSTNSASDKLLIVKQSCTRRSITLYSKKLLRFNVAIFPLFKKISRPPQAVCTRYLLYDGPVLTPYTSQSVWAQTSLYLCTVCLPVCKGDSTEVESLA